MTATAGAPSGILDRLSTPAWATRVGAFVRSHARSLVWLMPTLLIGAVVNFINLAGSPQRIDDEGTYTAQAWAMLNYGELAHYTYWYDHPPLGWMQIAGYTGLTGAFARWDLAVLAGREAMIVAALVSGALLWVLARRLYLSRPAAAVAVFVFLVSPLAVQFHRTVYLDNVATPWLLLAFVLALTRRGQLAAHVGAAVAFGIAVLSKETYLLALPFLIWAIVRNAHRETRRYTLSLAGSILVLIGGSYLLLAAVKGELMPGTDRVSLFDGLAFQLSTRDGSGSPFDPDSLMTRTLGMWWQLDPVIIVLGLVGAAAGLFMTRLRPFAVMVLALTAFMFRPGGYLPVPYVIMLIPFAALLIAAVGDRAVKAIRMRRSSGIPGVARKTAAFGGLAVLTAGLVAAAPLWGTQLRGFVLADLDVPMRDAQTWVTENASRDARLIVDDAMWVDLVKAGWDRENVVWYYKVDTDPAVQAQSPNGWRDADYVITTDSMRTFPDGFPQVQEAITNSVVVATFGTGTQQVDVRRVVPDGADAASQSIATALEARTALGTQLAVNPAVGLSDADAGLLTAGAVDDRIVEVLGALAADGDVAVAGFPALPGEDGSARRQVALTTVAGTEAVVDGRIAPAAQALVDGIGGVFAPEVFVQDGRLMLLFDASAENVLP